MVDEHLSNTPGKSNDQGAAKKPQIWPEHVEEVLKPRCITKEYAEKAGIKSMSLRALKEASEKYGFKIRGGLPDNLPLHKTTGIAIPYPMALDGKPRVRFRSDITSYVAGEGADAYDVSVPRYICQYGVPVIPLITDEVREIASDVTKPVYIVEAPLKAFSLSCNGWPAIGMGGVLAGAHDKEAKEDNDEIIASEELQKRVKWGGRKVYIIYDAMLQTNPMVALGAAYLYEALRKLGASVWIVRLPILHPEDTNPELGKFYESKDQGPDDFMYHNGKEALQKLIDEAVPADPAARLRHEIQGVKLRTERSAKVCPVLEELVFAACLHVGGPLVIDAAASVAKDADVSKKAVQAAANIFSTKLGAKAAGKQETWKSELQCTDSGIPKPVTYNVELCLRNDKTLAGLVAYDEFLQCLVFTRTPPWASIYKASATIKQGDPWSDDDDTRLSSYLTIHYGILDTKREKIQDALKVVSAEHKFHPVRQYLETRVWDGVSRLDTLAQVYLRSNPDLAEYYKLVIPMWFMSACARVFEPGCKQDYILVLEGEQGDHKTEALRILGGQWYSDASQNDLKDKEAAMKLFGSWIQAFDEGSIFARADARDMKEFTTKPYDDYIPKFSNRKSRFLRQCVFAMTTNDFQYLSDPTGNRRYHPIMCGNIDLEKFTADRDQLWAEAYHRYKQKERRYPTKEEEERLIVPEQEKRRRPEAFEEKLEEKLAGLNKVTIEQAIEMLDFKGTPNQIDRRNIVSSLRALGWKQKPGKIAGQTHRIYYRPGVDPDGGELVPTRFLTQAQELAKQAFEAAFGVEMVLETTKNGQVVRVWREKELTPGDSGVDDFLMSV